MSYDGPPILRDDRPGLRDLKRLVVAIGVIVALVGAWQINRGFAVFVAGLLLVYLGSKR